MLLGSSGQKVCFLWASSLGSLRRSHTRLDSGPLDAQGGRCCWRTARHQQDTGLLQAGVTSVVPLPLLKSCVGTWAVRPLPPGGGVLAFLVPNHFPALSRAPSHGGREAHWGPGPSCTLCLHMLHVTLWAWCCRVLLCGVGHSLLLQKPFGQKAGGFQLPLKGSASLASVAWKGAKPVLSHVSARPCLAPPWAPCSREQGWASGSVLRPRDQEPSAPHVSLSSAFLLSPACGLLRPLPWGKAAAT